MMANFNLTRDSLLGFRLLKRHWRSTELSTLVLALSIAVASLTAISLFNHRIDFSLATNAAEMLGANHILKSTQPVDDSIITKATTLKLNVSKSISLSSMIVYKDKFKLSHVKAVDDAYPLLGAIRISNSLVGNETHSPGGPAPGNAWLASSLMTQLDISIGDIIEIGNSHFKVSQILKYDPGETASLVSLAPRLLIHSSDLPSTGLVQPGSRVTYHTGFSGDEASMVQFINWLKPRLNATQALTGSTEGSAAINSAADKARQYLTLSTMLSVLLSGISIAMSATHYARRSYDQAAIMRSIGASSKSVITIFTSQIIVLGLLSSTIGIILAYLIESTVTSILSDVLTLNNDSFIIKPVFTGYISGLIILTAFTLPSLLRIGNVPPLRVLRNELTPPDTGIWILYLLAIASVISLMWWASGNLKSTVVVLTGIVISGLLLSFITKLLIYILPAIVSLLNGPFRQGLKQVNRNSNLHTLQVVSIGFSLVILALIYLVRTDLIIQWTNQLPDNAPNHFIINIQPSDVPKIKDLFNSLNINTRGLYPMVRGRISQINSIDIPADRELLDESLKRDLNLTWLANIQDNNRIIQGSWFSESNTGQYLISIESGLARRLGVTINDSLTFQILNTNIEARIKSIRQVKWDSFQPNFYIIFPDEVINHLPATYISSFYLQPDKKKQLSILVDKFPSITILELDNIMSQVRTIMLQVTKAIEFVMLLLLLSGTTVMAATLQASLQQRKKDAVILRSLGTSRSYLRNLILTELFTVAVVASILAIMGSEATAYLLYKYIFQLEFNLHFSTWLYMLLLSPAVIMAAGWLYLRKIPDQPPMNALRTF